MSQRKTLHMQSGFGKRLGELREKMGLTLQGFGHAIGYDKSYISRLESGKNENPSPEFLNRCASVFGVNPDWLATGEGQMLVAHATKKPFLGAIPMIEELRKTVQFDEFLRVIMSNLSPEHVGEIINDLRTSSVLTDASKDFWFPVCIEAFVRIAASGDQTQSKGVPDR